MLWCAVPCRTAVSLTLCLLACAFLPRLAGRKGRMGAFTVLFVVFSALLVCAAVLGIQEGVSMAHYVVRVPFAVK